MSSETRPDLLQPFAEADNFLRSLFVLWQAKVPLKRDDLFWQQLDNLDQVILLTEKAQAEFHGAVRAAELTETQAFDFLQRAIQDNHERDQEASPFTNFLIFRIAMGKLLQMTWAKYNDLHSPDQITIWPPVSHMTSDWYKNTTPEHIYRELEQTAKTLKRVSKNPPKAVNQHFNDVLRTGHIMAAISQVKHRSKSEGDDFLID